MINRQCFLKTFVVAGIVLGFLAYIGVSGAMAAQIPIPGKSIPKYVNSISPAAGSNLGIYNATAGGSFTVTMDEAIANILPTTFLLPNGLMYAGTWTWQYSITGTIYPVGGRDTYLGPAILAQRNNPVTVTYVNNLGFSNTSNVLFYGASVDQTLHWADPLGCMMAPTCNRFLNYVGPIPAVTHLHGGEVPSDFDGGPEQWFTSDWVYKGMNYRTANLPVPTNGAVYTYPNSQEAAPIWFHDHALGATRLNVYAGLAGGYLIADPANEPTNLPGPVPLVIQDRMFDTNGQLYFPNLGINPTIHPFWIPEFFGDVIVVNGKSWPKMNVDPKRYRFIILNGSNARFYELSLGRGGPDMWVIRTDGGYLDTPVKITYPNKLLIAPGERYEVSIDFKNFAGKTLTITNTAKAPYPKGAAPDPQTVGQIMQFVVSLNVVTDGTCDPALAGCARPTAMVRLPGTPLGPAISATNVQATRKLTLNEVMGAAGPLEVLVNNTKWDGTLSPNAGGITEHPRVGSTEVWEIINLTADAHPIHLHLVQFQLISRQPFNVSGYSKAYNVLFPAVTFNGITYPGGVYIPGYGPSKLYGFYNTGATPWLGGNPDATPFLQGKATPPNANEAGWKDTVIMYPGEVTRIAVRWASQDKTITGTFPGDTNAYPFDPTGTPIAYDASGILANGPGYVWHCHIIDHEDNEMMRPYTVAP